MRAASTASRAASWRLLLNKVGVTRGEEEDAHRDTNEGLQAKAGGGGHPQYNLANKAASVLGLPPPQTSSSGQDSISKLQNLGSIQPPVRA